METRLDRWIGLLSTGLAMISAVTFVCWIGIMAIFITCRAVFNVNWMFIEEFSAYIMVLLAFFPLAYSLRAGAHIRVDVVTRLLPERLKESLNIFTILLSIVVVGYLTNKGVLWFLYGLQSNVHSMFPSNFPMWPVYLIVPIGLGILGFALILALYLQAKKLFLNSL